MSRDRFSRRFTTLRPPEDCTDGTLTGFRHFPKEKQMTVPRARTGALIHTYELPLRLQDPKATPRVPRWLRGHAKALLRHYPT
jgi:hypothetical protein